MSDAQQKEVEPEEVETSEALEEEELDPEFVARRDAALAHVRKFGDPILKAKARPVTAFDDALGAQIDRMGLLMVDSVGIGLAATQVGLLNRVLTYRVQQDGPVHALVNPEIVWRSKDAEASPEGCLSLPTVQVEVERATFIRVRAQDRLGDPIVVEASGLEARVIQHEMDHLDGVLILNRTSRDEKREALRRLREWQDRQGL
jgi:peptide deformylase